LLKATFDMHDVGREETLRYLKASQERLAECQEMMEAGECLAVVRALADVRELNIQATSALMSGCLRHTLGMVQSVDEKEREKYLPELIRLVCFGLADLCPSCRREVGERLGKD
jgi:hypothetical protein